ncbi:hypothetical protein [Vibrio ruber]|nr:hypothetical protein [Vibrio ruber]
MEKINSPFDQPVEFDGEHTVNLSRLDFWLPDIALLTDTSLSQFLRGE